MEVQPLTAQVGLPPCTEILGALVIVGIGTAIKFHSGKVVPSPRWASKAGLEWLWRLLHEPRTVWRRALVCGPQFMALSLLDLIRHKSKTQA
jgi:UDP-N-acetyl-D-mannosaminuronic acid transferase (WecB/TagA/CpsF family)